MTTASATPASISCTLKRILRQFIIPVIGNNDVTFPDKFKDFPKGIRHGALFYSGGLFGVQLNFFMIKLAHVDAAFKLSALAPQAGGFFPW